MGLLDFFFARREASAGIAKERLQIVLAHERASRDAPEFLPALQRDLIGVVNKYLVVRQDLVRINLARQGSTSVLEINVEFDGTRPVMPVPKATQTAVRSYAAQRSGRKKR